MAKEVDERITCVASEQRKNLRELTQYNTLFGKLSFHGLQLVPDRAQEVLAVLDVLLRLDPLW